MLVSQFLFHVSVETGDLRRGEPSGVSSWWWCWTSDWARDVLTLCSCFFRRRFCNSVILVQGFIFDSDFTVSNYIMVSLLCSRTRRFRCWRFKYCGTWRDVDW